VDAVQKAAVLRLRPILMTTGAMVFGAIPLVLSHDAGYESRHAIGTVLIGGLCLGTFFTLFVLPAVYILIKGSKTADN
jgi:multidrug efflux pump